ncbi:MAG: hypothetical protein GX652_08215 [Burkholderiaceae bacterium]|nr:hypothetical protein [Burkholderiaceae bacterium]
MAYRPPPATRRDFANRDFANRDFVKRGFVKRGFVNRTPPSNLRRGLWKSLEALACLPVIAGLYASFGLLYLAILLAFESDIALETPYGVGLVALVLSGAMYAVRSGLARAAPHGQRDIMTRRCWQHSLAILVIPIAISWLDNETLYGALSPRDYWVEQARRHVESCNAIELVAIQAADSARVEATKFNMGIATRSDVQDSMAFFIDARQTLADCRADAAARKSHVESRLSKLQPTIRLLSAGR